MLLVLSGVMSASPAPVRAASKVADGFDECFNLSPFRPQPVVPNANIDTVLNGEVVPGFRRAFRTGMGLTA
jgi:hypothetical protein